MRKSKTKPFRRRFWVATFADGSVKQLYSKQKVKHLQGRLGDKVKIERKELY
jgi:hypothetical protein